MKNVLLFSLFCLAVGYSQAQRATFGLKGGLNAARLSVENVDNDDLDSRVNFHVGGLAHIHVSRYIAVQPEVYYSGQGVKVESSGSDPVWKLNYINVPVMLQYMSGNGFRLETGPQVGFLTTAKIEVGDVENNIKDDLNSIDFSWGFGASYLTRSGIGIGARYNLGISNVNEDENANEIKNRVFQAGLFFMLRGSR